MKKNIFLTKINCYFAFSERGLSEEKKIANLLVIDEMELSQKPCLLIALKNYWFSKNEECASVLTDYFDEFTLLAIEGFKSLIMNHKFTNISDLYDYTTSKHIVKKEALQRCNRNPSLKSIEKTVTVLDFEEKITAKGGRDFAHVMNQFNLRHLVLV